MIYEFRSADMAPETDRSRLMYTDTGTTQYPDGTTTYKGMGSAAYEALFVGLPGVEDATWYAPIKKGVSSLPASSDRYKCYVRQVAPNWFSFFDYPFIAGRPFTKDEYDLGKSAFQEVESEYKNYEAVMNPDFRCTVICERIARQLFGSAEEAIGKNLLINFMPSKVVGVVADVSSIFQTAYADVFQPFTLTNEEQTYGYWETGYLPVLGWAFSNWLPAPRRQTYAKRWNAVNRYSTASIQNTNSRCRTSTRIPSRPSSAVAL